MSAAAFTTTGTTGRRGLAARSVLLAIAVLAGLWAATGDVFTTAFYMTYAVTGAVLIAVRPRNVIGWLLAGAAWGFIGTTTSPTIDIAALQAGTAPLGLQLAAWFNGWAGYASFTLFLTLAIVFPAGRLPVGRWRSVAVGLLVVAILLTAAFAFAPQISVNPDGVNSVWIPNPFAIAPGFIGWSWLPVDVGVLIIVGMLAIALVSMVDRYRHSAGIERLQFRWLVAAIGFLVVAMVTSFSLIVLFGDEVGGLVWVPAIVAYPMIPIAVTVAVLRYRLLEIDRLISRTISYALVTVTLFVVFAGVNLVTQNVLGAFVRGNTAAIAVSTLAVAALFNPLRVRLQGVVDRRFNRHRIDQERTLETFAVGLREDMDLDRLGEHVRATVALTLEPRSVALWRRPTAGMR